MKTIKTHAAALVAFLLLGVAMLCPPLPPSEVSKPMSPFFMAYIFSSFFLGALYLIVRYELRQQFLEQKD